MRGKRAESDPPKRKRCKALCFLASVILTALYRACRYDLDSHYAPNRPRFLKP